VILPLLLTNLAVASPGPAARPVGPPAADPEFFGIVGMDPWYAWNTDPVNFPNDLNKAFLEQMMADLANLGARWVRVEIHPELNTPEGPGPIDYAKHDWFFNELIPKYGIEPLVVMGTGLIGDKDSDWNFKYVNEPLGPDDSNRYIDMYIERLRELLHRYGPNIGAIEVLNEPNAMLILHMATLGEQKAVLPANYGVLIRRAYEAVQEIQPEIEVVLGGLLYDTEYDTVPLGKEYTFDLDWLEAVYGSRAVRTYAAEHGRPPFDAVAVHPYHLDPNGVVAYLNTVRRLQLRFDDRFGRIWVTEIGRPAEPPDSWSAFGATVPSASEVEQAAFLSALYTTVRQRCSFVDRIFWFKYEDFPEPDNTWSGYGLVRMYDAMENYGQHAIPWPRKFAYAVYQALAQPYRQPMARVEPPPAGQPGVRYFEETGHTLRDPFLQFWEAHGGEAVFGPPLTEPFQLAGRTVQYFERVRLDHLPEQAGTGAEVQLGPLGSFLAYGRGFPAQPPDAPPVADARYFPETSQYLAGVFRAFWETNGGLERFGYPISGEIVEDGLTVQYFERARLELHVPQGGAPVVSLGELGREVLATPGWYR
jgi:hypothetical protein